jgi:hypothetical protein
MLIEMGWGGAKGTALIKTNPSGSTTEEKSGTNSK